MRPIYLVLTLATLLLLGGVAQAETLSLHLPLYKEGQHKYFFDILQSALEEDGHEVTIQGVGPLPHLREREMFRHGEIDVLWLIRSTKRDRHLVCTDIPLTNGLIGQRFLLINPETRYHYTGVKTLSDFRALNKVGAHGTGWFDARVWEANDLPCVEKANWLLVYNMLMRGDRGVDYFPRGFTEILQELEANPYLEIEPTLMLEYERDFVFYVNPQVPELAPIIRKALQKAKDSGLMDRLIKKHWAKAFKVLKPEDRTVIRLSLPE